MGGAVHLVCQGAFTLSIDQERPGARVAWEIFGSSSLARGRFRLSTFDLLGAQILGGASFAQLAYLSVADHRAQNCLDRCRAHIGENAANVRL